MNEFTIQNKPLGTIPGIAFKNKEGGIEQTQDAKFNRNLDELPLPLWEKFPLNGYWDIGFAHAPVRKEKFLPILTSRGCPYRCTFCVAPEVNPKWRSRSAKNIADEMEYFYWVTSRLSR